MPTQKLDKATRIAHLQELIEKAEADVVNLQRELERISRPLQERIRSQENVRDFLRGQLAAIESPDREPFVGTREFSGKPIRECIETILRERGSMRLIDITRALLERGFQTKSKERAFASNVVGALGRGAKKGAFEKRGKLWQLRRTES